MQKRIAWVQSEAGKASRKRANAKWRNSEKGKQHILKENEIRRIAREYLRMERAKHVKDDTTPPLTPNTQGFVNWCEQEYEDQSKQWKQEIADRKKQHTADYFNKYNSP